tara:strand:- start:13 stop:237 length:225 start_codon:yes stop_codon:yes gene_type:complete
MTIWSNNMTYKELVNIFEESFNYRIDFKTWRKKEFINFVKDFMNGKTEYYKDDNFIKLYDDKVKKYIRGKNENK